MWAVRVGVAYSRIKRVGVAYSRNKVGVAYSHNKFSRNKRALRTKLRFVGVRVGVAPCGR